MLRMEKAPKPIMVKRPKRVWHVRSQVCNYDGGLYLNSLDRALVKRGIYAIVNTCSCIWVD